MPHPETGLSQWARDRLAETGGDLAQLSEAEFQDLAAEFSRLPKAQDEERDGKLQPAPKAPDQGPPGALDEVAPLLRHPDLLGHFFLPDTTELSVGPALARFFGTTPQAMVGQRWLDNVPEDEREDIRRHLASYTPDNPFGVYEINGVDAVGQWCCIRWFNHAVFDEEGNLKYFEAVGMDLTEQKRLADRVDSERAFANGIIDTLPELYFMIDSKGNYLRWNKAHEEMSGYNSEEMKHKHPLDFVSVKDRGRVREAIQRAFDGEDSKVEAELVTRSGQTAPFLLNSRRVILNGEMMINGFGINITKRKYLEEQLKYQAAHDSLTDLWNRGAFEEMMKKEIHRTRRHDKTFAIVMLDIDHFKMVNDDCGHAIGDGVLQQLAELMKSRFRESDIPARWGGEEFMILLPETELHGARKLAEDLREAVEDTAFPGAGRVTISAGVVCYRAREDVETLTKRVDDTLYAAKEAGRNRVVSD